MSFLDLANSRYTTKRYNPNFKLTEDKIEQLKEILRMTPSSINGQPWKFIFISDDEIKSKLAAASYFNKKRIEEASHLVVFNVLDNIEKFENQIQQYLPEIALEFYRQNLKSQSDDVIKAWFAHQVYLALGFFLSACANMGIDSTPMEGIDKDIYTQILQPSVDYKPLFAVSIGYRDPQDTNQPSITPKFRLALNDIIESI